MKAFHNDPAIKAKYIARVRAHREADQLIKGTYWGNGKGCAVGCTVHSASHCAYEVELGIPRILARLEDGIFEGLPNGKAKVWPEAFLQSIPVGADLTGVFYVFMEWLLLDKKDGIIRFAKTDKVQKAIQEVGDLFKRRIGEVITSDQWWAVRRAADAAYAAAADAAAAAAAAAADDAAAAAAYAATAADAADDAAAYAAYAAAAAAYAATAADAHCKARIRQSEKLIELLEGAKV